MSSFLALNDMSTVFDLYFGRYHCVVVPSVLMQSVPKVRNGGAKSSKGLSYGT